MQGKAAVGLLDSRSAQTLHSVELPSLETNGWRSVGVVSREASLGR